MRILITGSSGFLGVNLVKHIQTERPDWEIFGFDLKSSKNTNYNYEALNFNSNVDWKEKLRTIEPDMIFHLVGLFRGTKEEMYSTNVSSFQSFIEGFRDSELESRLLVLGSSAQYGADSSITKPLKENQQTQPSNYYGETKDNQEKIALSFHEKYGIDVLCTRPGSLVGKGVSTHLLSGFLTEKFKKNEKTIKIEISNSSDVRDYIDVRDTCSAILLLQEMTGITGDVFNISANQLLSNLELIKVYEKISEKRALVTYSQPDRNPTKIWLDNSKLAKCCSFQPKFSIEDSVRWNLS
jgi:nucleoside-diphosphate-sugar epimerase